jgi:lipid-A-disaccharide synthase-like uncharacterized protein
MHEWFSSSALWYGIGMVGQVLFGSRFLLQWVASEQARRSVLPRAFWYLSLTGGAALLAYAVHRHDPVFAIGQAAGLAVYARNLALHRGPAAA